MNILVQNNMEKNNIFLSRKNKVIVPVTSGGEVSKGMLAAGLRNFESLGYILSPSLIEALSKTDDEFFQHFYKEMFSCMKKLKGDNVQHLPMYPNFPKEVMEKSETELYFNALVHYFSSALEDFAGFSLHNKGLPEIEKEERLPLFEDGDMTVVQLGTEEEFNEMIRDLINSKTSISDFDKKHIKFALDSVKNKEDLNSFLPEEIPHREIMTFVVGNLLSKKDLFEKEEDFQSLVSKYLKTPTDVLRLAVSMSDGDISLSSRITFRKFKRYERRLFLHALNGMKDLEREMVGMKPLWITLGEIIHPGEYKNRYKRTFKAFKALRNDKKIITFNGMVEEALLKKDVEKAVDLLKTRPGEFARRLDHLFRLGTKGDFVVAEFDKVTKEISTPVLLQVLTHFKHRNSAEESKYHTYLPKGNISRAFAKEMSRDKIDKELTSGIVNVCRGALIQRFSELPSIGNAIVDESLKRYTVPFGERSASDSLRRLSRASRLPMSEKGTIRMFIHWKGFPDNDRVDVDASVAFLNESWEYVEHISYTNLKSNYIGAYHSGDITNPPKDGASEFIDIDIEKASSRGVRYVILQVHSFTNQPFSEIPDCFVGWMGREHVDSGEIFEPSTVEQKIDVTSTTSVSIPVVFDLEKREAIWLDLGMKHFPDFGYNNIERHFGNTTKIVRGMLERDFPNLYDLFELHAIARGNLITEDELEKENEKRLKEHRTLIKEGQIEKDKKPDLLKTDVRFGEKGDVTPFDFEKIISEFLQ